MKIIKYFSLIYLILLLNSCFEKKVPQVKVGNESANFWELTFRELFNNLPKKINEKDYWVVYRIGSIEFSKTASVLCIRKSDLKSEQINCSYYSFNIEEESKLLPYIQPTVIGHDLLLTNEFHGRSLSVEKLKRCSFNDLNDYISNKPKTHSGEWHCGNLFVVNPFTKNNFFLIDKDSEKDEKAFIKSIYKQISPSEYFQSFSLDLDCSNQDKLRQYLNSSHATDTLKFKIDYKISDNYW